MPGVISWIVSLVAPDQITLYAALSILFALMIAVMVRTLMDMVRARTAAPIAPPAPVVVAPVGWTPNQIGYVQPPVAHYAGIHPWIGLRDMFNYPTFVRGNVRNYRDAISMNGVLPTRQDALSGTQWGGVGPGDLGVPHNHITRLNREFDNVRIGAAPANSIEHCICLLEFITDELSAGRAGPTSGGPRCGFKYGLLFIFLHDISQGPHWNNMNATHQEYALCLFLDIKQARENHVRVNSQILWKHLQP